MADLESCPHCGSTETAMDRDHFEHWVRCLTCSMQGPAHYRRSEAARLWNALPRNVTPDVSSTQDCPAWDDNLMLPAMAVIRRDYFAARIAGGVAADPTLSSLEAAAKWVCGFTDAVIAELGRGANARLIAAAPDLLEALRECRPFLVSAIRRGDATAQEELGRLDSAIAKAEGGSDG